MNKTLTASLSIAALAVNIQAMEVPKSNFDQLPPELKINIIGEASPNELTRTAIFIKDYCEKNREYNYKFCTNTFSEIADKFIQYPEIGIIYGIPLKMKEFGMYYNQFNEDPFLDIYNFYDLPLFRMLKNHEESIKSALIRIENDTEQVLLSLKNTLDLKALKNYRLVCTDFNKIIMEDANFAFAVYIKPAQEAIKQEFIANKKKSSLLKKTKEKTKSFFDSLKK